MSRTLRTVVVAVVLALAVAAVPCPEAPGQIVYPPSLTSRGLEPSLSVSAIGAVIDANDGKPPATGEQLWKALNKIGRCCQLPLPFSAVHLESGLAQPRVIITPYLSGIGKAAVTDSNLAGRLFLAANMELSPNGVDPIVTSVEFISWNNARRQFDFGVIEDMGGDGPAHLRIVDGGKCFACHKNRGPILGGAPWSNSTHDDILRLAAATGLRLSGSHLPASGPFALPEAGRYLRERIDGMALALPEAKHVDAAVRHGADLRLNRDVFRLMTRSPEGKQALVILLTAITAPGPLDPDDKTVKMAVDGAFEKSFSRFAADWVDLQKEAKPSLLFDVDPASLLVASGVRPITSAYLNSALSAATVRTTTSTFSVPTGGRTVQVPGLTGGGGSRWAAIPTGSRNVTVSRQSLGLVAPAAAYSIMSAARAAAALQANSDLTATLTELTRYETARSGGSHGLTSHAQPSNPRAFFKPPVKTPGRASGVVNTVILAGAIGLTEGDRKFLADTLAEAAKRVNTPKVTAATLGRAVFEGPEFTDVLDGGPLPDRDDFKDRFVAGLDGLLRKDFPATNGYPINRSEYARGPKYDAKAYLVEKDIAVVPTSACLRCHEVRASGKSRRLEPIPALAFDPFDKPGREAWLRTADRQRRLAVLGRMQQRLATDTDMPPEDAPEYERFRMRDPAAFEEVTGFLKAELDRLK